MKYLSTIFLVMLLLLVIAPTFAQDDDESYFQEKKRKFRKGTHHYLKFDLGTNNYLQKGDFPDANNELYAVKPFGSWYLGINSIHKTNILGPLFLEWGGGFSWYNFKYDNADTRIAKTDSMVVFFTDIRDISPIKSKLTASYLHVSLVPVFDFGYTERARNHWHSHDGDFNLDFNRRYGIRVGFGGYAAYRLSSHSKQVYSEGGDREKDKENSNFYLNNIRYGFRAQLGIGRIDLFANYDLNELFSDNRGPELNPFSFGLIVF